MSAGRSIRSNATLGRASELYTLLRRHLGIKAFICVVTLLLTLDLALEHESSYSRQLWTEIARHSIGGGDMTIRALLDPTLAVKTPGEDLLDQLATSTGPYTMEVLSVPRSGRPFEIAVQCGAEIIGDTHCPPMYYLHFRGPVAYSVPPRYDAFKHNATTGRTVVTATLTHPGIYELWGYPEWPVPDKCPSEMNHWDQNTPPIPAIAGSGQLIVNVEEEVPPPSHHTRHCTYEDYRTPMESAWFSLEHIRPQYKEQAWLASHVNRSNSLIPYGEMPDYVYLPYQCKRPALDFRAMADANKALKHVLYIGDSIQRSHFCGHLWPTFNEGLVPDPSKPETMQCVYSDSTTDYHFADHSFDWPRRETGGSGASESIRFSQRFVADNPQVARGHLEALAAAQPPVSHVVANIGMWFGRNSPEQYAGAVHVVLRLIIEILGPDVHITWLHTAASVPGIMCWNQMKRERLRHFSSYANTVIDEMRDWYPMLSIRAIDAFAILDSRPESASDGRHYVREGPLPDIKRRPLVGRGDDAVHDNMWAAWLEDYRHSIGES